MPLSDEQDERLTLILDGLEAVRAKLYPGARNFLDDQIKRHAQYGKSMFLSPKQGVWLENLYREFVGTEPETVDAQQEDHALDEAEDMDDGNVPF